MKVNTPQFLVEMRFTKLSQLLSFQRLQKYKLLLLAAENIPLRRSNTLNLDEGEPHRECTDITQNLEEVRADVTDITLSTPDLTQRRGATSQLRFLVVMLLI